MPPSIYRKGINLNTDNAEETVSWPNWLGQLCKIPEATSSSPLD